LRGKERDRAAISNEERKRRVDKVYNKRRPRSLERRRKLSFGRPIENGFDRERAISISREGEKKEKRKAFIDIPQVQNDAAGANHRREKVPCPSD